MRQTLKVENQNDLRLRGLSGFNPFAAFTSSSRMQMQSSNISQAYVFNMTEPNSIQTGIEQEYGKYTYSIKAEHNITRVLAIIPRYIPTNQNNIGYNPERVVIYQGYDDNGNVIYGCMEIARFNKNHTKFGFEFKECDGAQEYLREGASIPKGKVLYSSPNVGEHGEYGTGIELNTAYMSFEEADKDSVIISESTAEMLSAKVYTQLKVELNKNDIPLNIYGDDHVYKIMPDIGEKCHPVNSGYNGLVMATRKIDPILLPVLFNKKTLKQIRYFTDNVYDGNGNDAEVVDIVVIRQNKPSRAAATTVTMQLDKYADAYIQFNERILSIYYQIMKSTNNQANFTNELNHLIVNAMAITQGEGRNTKASVLKVGKFNERLPDYTVYITTRYTKKITNGYKVTNVHGGKGVISSIRKDEEMPVDPVTGRRAQIMFSPETVTNRMNPGVINEMGLKDAMVDLREEVILMLGGDIHKLRNKVNFNRIPTDIMSKAIARVERFYEIVSEKHHQWFSSLNFDEKREDLHYMIREKMYLYRPLNTPNDLLDSLDILEEEGYLKDGNYVEYVNRHSENREVVTSKTRVRIGPVYYWLLEKIGDSAAAVATARRLVSGIPATIQSDADSQIRHQPGRFPAEAENRILTTASVQGIAVELHDQSNSPRTVTEVLKTIYSSEKPTAIPVVVDRNVVPLGQAKPLQMLNEGLDLLGVKYQYSEFSDDVGMYVGDGSQLNLMIDDLSEETTDEE